MRFASLGSGSSGNAMVVEAAPVSNIALGVTRVLLDCGFGPRELANRLSRLGLTISDLDAIVVTHEHSDHSAGVFKAAQRCDLDVYLTHGTLAGMPGTHGKLPKLVVIDSHRPFVVGSLEIHPFPVPHDAREPVQFVFSSGRCKLGVLTDTGSVTPHIISMLDGCDALVLECNHDIEMLTGGAYPRTLKQRIGGRFGHLDNQASAALLGAIDCSRLQHLVAAHLSIQNNTTELVRAALAAALDCDANWIGVASQEAGFCWRELK
ncbi:MAG: MBL fold metallo-hydrolase [Sterolibacterium sp.]